MSKKLTPTIAKALAEKVRAELVVRHKGNTEALTKKVESSKLYKELLLTIKKIDELDEKKQVLRKEIDYFNSLLEKMMLLILHLYTI